MKNLLEAMENSKKTKKEISELTNISQKQLYNIAHGLSEATESKIIALCTVLNVSADYLLGIENKQ